MPFASKAQRAYLEMHHPDLAKKFAEHTSKWEEKHLPEHKSPKKKRRLKKRKK